MIHALATGASGESFFRTIKAGLYGGRTRHFHLAVMIPGQAKHYISQTLWNKTARARDGNVWDIQNNKDMVLTGVSDAAQRRSLILDHASVDRVTNAVEARLISR